MNLLKSLIDPTVPRNRRLLRCLLLTLLAAACAYRVWLVVDLNPANNIWSDPARHWAHGARPAEPTPWSAIDPVIYQVYMAVLAKLTVQSPALVAYWTALLSLLGPWLWHRFLRELLVDRDWALAGWVAFAALPSWSAIYSYFMQETLMLPLLGAALWATWRCRRKGDTASFTVAVGAWLLAGLTRGIALPLALVAMAWIWAAQGHKLPRAAAAIALIAAVMVPLAGRSWALARLVAPHGIASLVQIYHQAGTRSLTADFKRSGRNEHWSYDILSPAVLDRPLEPLSDWQSSRRLHTHVTIDLDAGRWDWQAAKDRLPPWDFDRYLWLTGENLVLLFFGRSWPETDRQRLIGEVNYWARWLWVPLTLVGLVWTVVRWRQERERMLLALICTWVAVQGLFPLAVNEGRYRKPFEGLLIAQCLLLAAGGRGHMRRTADGFSRRPPSSPSMVR